MDVTVLFSFAKTAVFISNHGVAVLSAIFLQFVCKTLIQSVF